MSASKSVIPQFLPGSFPLSVKVSGTGNGTVTDNHNSISCGSLCGAVYTSGSQVTLTANAATGTKFTGWNGGGCSGTGSCSVTMNNAQQVTAAFTLEADLSVKIAGGGGGAVTSGDTFINCNSGTCDHYYLPGAVVTLTAAAASGSVFSGWSGGGCAGPGATCTVTMSAAKTVTATFNTAYALSVTVNPTGLASGSPSGLVTSAPSGIVCGSGSASCTANYPAASIVTLTAIATSGSLFNGGCSGTGSTCVVTMSAAQAVTATFVTPPKQTLTLNVHTTGGAGGSITDNVNSFNVTTFGSEQVAGNSTVILTESPGLNSAFTGWSGACSGTSPGCQVKMTAAEEVTANFAAAYQLSISNTSDAFFGTFGTVTSAPSGINCGTTCAAAFPSGQSVTLTATPTAEVTFKGWNGAGCAGTGSCTVTMSQAQSVTAQWKQQKFLLSVLANGPGNVTSSEGGINVSDNGSQAAEITFSDTVTLTATPDGNPGDHTFTGWDGGGCIGSSPTCAVTMNLAESVRATFQ